MRIATEIPTPSCSCATVQQVERAEGSCTRHTQRDHGRREQLRLDESMAMACVVGAVQTNSAARAIGSCHRLVPSARHFSPSTHAM